jgi:hypothetical protein
VVCALLLIVLAGSYAVASGPVARKAGDYFSAFEAEPYMMAEDFGNEPLYDCAHQYYYYIPCPTYSWFWAYSGWKPGDILGASFTIGDTPTGGYWPCDPMTCRSIETIRVLDFAGYGTVYPGLFTIELDLYCCDTEGYPCYHLWNSGPFETQYGWNYIEARAPVSTVTCLEECDLWWTDSSIALTMTMTGTEGLYPAVGFDNISSSVHTGCIMHDYGCLPAVYPRTWAGGTGPKVHSGYLGSHAFQYWPPLPLPDGSPYDPVMKVRFGFVEAAWRIYVICTGPALREAGTHPTTWGAIKSMYE